MSLCSKAWGTKRHRAVKQKVRIPPGGWLPSRYKSRTNHPKTAWERTHFYTRTYSKHRVFIRGQKPQELAHIARITTRQWAQYECGLKRDNPILKGMRWLRVFEDESVRTYAQAAEIIGVSRERVYQLTSLVTKLPPRIKDFLAGTKDPDLLRFFTERRLRPLTMLSDAETQMAQFTELLAEAKEGKSDPDEILGQLATDSGQAVVLGSGAGKR